MSKARQVYVEALCAACYSQVRIVIMLLSFGPNRSFRPSDAVRQAGRERIGTRLMFAAKGGRGQGQRLWAWVSRLSFFFPSTALGSTSFLLHVLSPRKKGERPCPRQTCQFPSCLLLSSPVGLPALQMGSGCHLPRVSEAVFSQRGCHSSIISGLAGSASVFPFW